MISVIRLLACLALMLLIAAFVLAVVSEVADEWVVDDDETGSDWHIGLWHYCSEEPAGSLVTSTFAPTSPIEIERCVQTDDLFDTYPDCADDLENSVHSTRGLLTTGVCFLFVAVILTAILATAGSKQLRCFGPKAALPALAMLCAFLGFVFVLAAWSVISVVWDETHCGIEINNNLAQWGSAYWEALAAWIIALVASILLCIALALACARKVRREISSTSETTLDYLPPIRPPPTQVVYTQQSQPSYTQAPQQVVRAASPYMSPVLI
eukprot:NODE_3407_length_973_cov_149.776596_g3260_i0.p1 GENE.NODE_3407_length_973_cov_149.776596_g3260_i0~~NODE_3407_length_973_cov_149.776596_g3260_i0.p1  ORF type:complete len:268 (-),score=49.66 NODE_3407_length_973_cov_149.776596_g3260_i0:113-916(-)